MRAILAPESYAFAFNLESLIAVTPDWRRKVVTRCHSIGIFIENLQQLWFEYIATDNLEYRTQYNYESDAWIKIILRRFRTIIFWFWFRYIKVFLWKCLHWRLNFMCSTDSMHIYNIYQPFLKKSDGPNIFFWQYRSLQYIYGRTILSNSLSQGQWMR